MNREQFTNALDGISDGLIDAAAGAYEKKANKKWILRCAACALLVLTAIGLFWNAPAGAPDPTQPTISVEHPTTVPTTQPEKGSKGAKISFLSTKNGEETETPLEIGITTPIDYIVYVRNLRGLSDEKRSEVTEQWREFDCSMRDGTDAYTSSTFVGKEVIVGTYMKGHLEITSTRSEIVMVSVDTINEGIGDHGWGQAGGEFHVNWFLNPGVLIEDPSIPLSTIRDSLEVTITYKDGTAEIIIIDISLNDEGQVFATLVEDQVNA